MTASPSPAAGALEWMAYAHARFTVFDFAAGHAALEETLVRDPGFLPARWARFQIPHSPTHASEADLAAFRERWRAGVAEFAAIDWNDPRFRPQIWGCVGQCTAFYRHYLGDDATADQRDYGALVTHMMQSLAGPIRPPSPPPRSRLRVVYISAYTWEHTVARLFGPLFTRLDRERFDTHLLQLDPATDTVTDGLVAGFGHTHRGPREANAWCQLLVQLAPDIIVYSDIGMHPLPQGLASLRLAPTQCVLWGHPVTTGLAAIDLFVSSQWFEPPQALRDYTETLFCLPGLGAAIGPPTVAARCPRSWPPQGARTWVELLCAQSIFKLMPAQIEAFAKILAAAPDARLHLAGHADPAIRAALALRITQQLAALGGDPSERIVMHPLLPLDEFRGLADRCDLGLDTMGWSGGMSSLDQLGEQLPVLTLPGNSMRSRQTAALLGELDAHELIASDMDDYCARAVQLIADPDLRDELRRRIRDHADRLYNTAPAVHGAFADFLERAAARPPG